jgi:hypothetical protein
MAANQAHILSSLEALGDVAAGGRQGQLGGILRQMERAMDPGKSFDIYIKDALI